MSETYDLGFNPDDMVKMNMELKKGWTARHSYNMMYLEQKKGWTARHSYNMLYLGQKKGWTARHRLEPLAARILVPYIISLGILSSFILRFGGENFLSYGILVSYIMRSGRINLRPPLPKIAGLSRSGKCCRPGCTSKLTPDIKGGNFSTIAVAELLQNFGNSVGIGNEELKDLILQIDDLQVVSDPDGETSRFVAYQQDLESVNQIDDNHCVHPGSPEAPIVQQNPLETLSTAPNDPQIQPQTQDVATGGPTTPTPRETIEDNRYKGLNKLAIVISSTTGLALLTVRHDGNQSLSHNTKILQHCAAGSSVGGFLAAFINILMMSRQYRQLVARILTIIACAGAAYGFIAFMGMLLPDKLKLWITIAACVLFMPALAAGLKE